MFQDFFKPLFLDIKKIITDTLFPISCLSCKQEGAFLCENCALKLPLVEYQMCIVCKKPSLGGLTHPKCASPYSPDQLISIYDYHNDVVEKLIIRGKYYFIKDIFELFGNLIANRIKSDFPNLLKATSYNLIAIPLNKWRLRWRGFNQSEILANVLAKELSLPIANVLVRNKITRTQKNLKREARIINVQNAFAFNSPPARGGVRGGGRDTSNSLFPVENHHSSSLPLVGRVREGVENKSCILHHKSFNCILIDDVTTTGSTLIEATKVLKRNGAQKVICLTIARD